MTWIAGWNMPGYLPETEPDLFATWEDAHDYLRETVERWADEDTEADYEDDTASTLAALGAVKADDARQPFAIFHGDLVLWVTLGPDEPYDHADDTERSQLAGGMGR